ncbi:hypothetical protein ACLOJK_033705 [Asimina triloba]
MYGVILYDLPLLLFVVSLLDKDSPELSLRRMQRKNERLERSRPQPSLVGVWASESISEISLQVAANPP